MSYLYVIHAQEFYKIGIATDVRSRVASLQTGNPYPIEVCVYYEFDNAAPVEQSIHQRFSVKRQLGEWFKLDSGDLATIDQICTLLGGSREEHFLTVSEEDTENAEVSAEIAENLPIAAQIESLIQAGWRIELDARKQCATLRWRRNGEDKSIGLGRITPQIEELAKERVGRGNRINHPGN